MSSAKAQPKTKPLKNAPQKTPVAASPQPATTKATNSTKGSSYSSWPKFYALISLIVLLATTVLWSYLGAKLQQNNADQLADPYLFDSRATFHNADFPGAHSFLIKWPLFFLIKLFSFSDGAFSVITILSVLVTVSALAYLLHRIVRQPVAFGTLCLALASVLLLIPAQPYAGGLLPLNMATLATRNLEYVLYIGAIWLFISSPSHRNWRFWASGGLLGLLIASDKLFLSISLAAALLALIIYALKHSWDFVSLSSRWFLTALGSSIFAIVLLSLINAIGLTNISSANSPYSLISGGRDLALGLLYSVMGLFTNFGANPAYDATIVRNIPHQLLSRLFSLGGPAYIINFLILGLGLYSAYELIKTSLAFKKSRLITDKYSVLALVLLWSSLAAFGVFILSSHYYAVDARYLTVVLFGLFISGAVLVRNHKWPQTKLAIVGGILAIGVLLGIVSSIRTYHTQSTALAAINERDHLVAQALKNHPVNVLVGDYWRVLPTRQASGNKLAVMPLDSCVSPRAALSSSNWQPNLAHLKFAYLLSLDAGLTNYPRCSLNDALSTYGRPNSSILIAGTFAQPKELLLIYDHGIHLVPPKAGDTAKLPSTILPVSLSDLPSTACSVPTSMNIVAHQDDDLLFMNPDLEHDIKAGHCERTVYITAGDSGMDKFYWLAREQGSEAAYSEMLGKNEVWIERTVKITDKEFISIATPRGNSKISLIFVHLPDGNLRGNGFEATDFESLEKLESGRIPLMHSVDKQSSYSTDDLVSLLSALMHVYQPADIRTQANYFGQQSADHSDHKAVSRLVKKAYAEYEQQQFEGQVTIPISYFDGYTVSQMPENVSGDDLAAKQAAFFNYAKFDGAACNNVDQCNKASVYGLYLTREYQSQD